jgi:hypothetical protein
MTPAMLRLAMVSRGKPDPRWALFVKIVALPSRLCTGMCHRKENCNPDGKKLIKP